MFDFLANGLTLVISLLLPTFLTYKALQTLPNPSATSPSAATAATNDFLSFIQNVNAYANNQNTPNSTQPNPIALLRPWLTYWITLALVNAAFGFVSPITAFVPFFAWFRLMLHIYLVVPGTAERIYQDRIQPFLRQHEAEIEDFIGQAHEKLKGRVLDTLSKLLDIVRSLGVGGTSTAQSNGQNIPPPDNMNYVQGLLARFTVASSAQAARSPPTPSSSASSRNAPPPPNDPIEALAATGKAVRDLYGKFKTQGPTDNFTTVTRIPSGSSSGAAQGHLDGNVRRSKSELEFETINQEDAMGSSGIVSSSSGSGGSRSPSGSAGWGDWLFGSGGNGGAVAAGSEGSKGGKGRSKGKSKHKGE